MTTRTNLTALTGALLLAASAAAAEPTADHVAQAFEGGKVSLKVRTRYENVQQTGLQDANALTIGTKLAFTTAAIQGFKASLEVEDVSAADGDAYNQAGLNPDGAGRAVVADPTGTEVNQAWLGYTYGKTSFKLGRQSLVLDNARFVGNVGWRQNMQTFDAFTVQDKSFDHLTLTYSYLNRINRIFGRAHPQGVWQSDSHVLHASYAGLPVGTLTGYAYLLDFDNAAANSTATFGASLAGARPISEDAKVGYRAEFAVQQDYGSSTLDYSADYYLGELGVTVRKVTGTVGYEVLGSDNGVGFKTPLATLHAFNGWADLFLATPAGGLRDLYGKVTVPLPAGFAFVGLYHQFDTDTGANLGDEVDLQVTCKINKYLTGLLKYATFDSASSALANVDKFWVQAEFTF